MEKKRYRGLLVDLFGTVIPKPSRTSHDRFMDRISEIMSCDPLKVREKWHASYVRRITGKDRTSRGFIEHFSGIMDCEVSNEVIDLIDGEWFDITRNLMVFFKDVEPVLEELRSRGMSIGLVTNCGANVPLLFEEDPISKLFDTMIYSSSEGLTKPDPRLFKAGCENLGISPQSCAFVGDGDNDELIGSSKAGLFTIKIDRGEEAGDYMIKESKDWDPTISSFQQLPNLLK